MSKEKYLSCILFKNEKGLLGKVATILGQNDVNIENINISSVNSDETIQKVIVYTSGIRSEQVLNELIKSMPEVLDVFTFKNHENVIEKEVCLVKINNKNNEIIKLTNLIKAQNGKLIFMNGMLSIYEVVDEISKINTLVEELNKISNDIDISRSLVVATTECKQ